jgi:hypothetical protein
VTRPYKFHPGSDVDIAVENINPELHFDAIANNGLFRTLSIFKLLSEQGFSDGLS